MVSSLYILGKYEIDDKYTILHNGFIMKTPFNRRFNKSGINYGCNKIGIYKYRNEQNFMFLTI